jgi:hypothetical protein
MKVEWESNNQRYSFNHILTLLDSYSDICCGDFTVGSSLDYPLNRQSFTRAPFESSAIYKADLDIAIDKLGRPGEWLRWCKNIDQDFKGLSHKQVRLARYINNDPYVRIKRIIIELCKVM